jgi:hypothetical protein
MDNGLNVHFIKYILFQNIFIIFSRLSNHREAFLVPGRNGDQLVQSCENEKVSCRVKEERNILHKIKRRRANRIGYTLLGISF